MTSELKKIGVLTSGGDAPGMNAAIRAVVRTASYYNLEVYGITHGYEGMIKGEIHRLYNEDVANIIHRGGTILKTARSEEFKTIEGRKQAYQSLKNHEIDSLIVIGGNGSYTGAMYLEQEHPLKIVGLPGTIDNDIFGTDNTIGFDTAINTAIDAVDKIRDTADSHARVFFIEVMGRHAGYIALHTGIGSGAGTIFLPETQTGIEEFIQKLKSSERRDKLFNLVIVAEGNKNGGASELVDKIHKALPEIEARATVIGHLQRGGSPTADDRVLASRLGYNAVIALRNGKSGKALGIINNTISFTDFSDAIKQSKGFDSDLLAMAEILAT